VSDLGTFHRLLVMQLAQSVPARLRDGLPIGEIRDTLLPYRRFRGPLGVHMEEDYDALLLQLAAGDDGYASLDDAAILKLFQSERRSSNPDLSQLEVHGTALLTLDADRVARVLAEYEAATAAPTDGLVIIDEADEDAEDDLPLDVARAAIHAAPVEATKPPAPAPAVETPKPMTPVQPAPPAPPAMAAAPAPVDAAPAVPFCPFCGGDLPVGRAVRFCPHCGQNQKTMPCPDCGVEADIGWKHCVACGCGLPSL